MIVRDQSKNYFHLTPKIGPLWGGGVLSGEVGLNSYFFLLPLHHTQQHSTLPARDRLNETKLSLFDSCINCSITVLPGGAGTDLRSTYMYL